MSKRKGGTGNAPNGQRTNAAAIEQANRVVMALDMRRAGHSFAEIAEALGWNSKQAAYAAVSKALEDTIAEPAADVRKLELMRLDRLEKLLWPRAEAGDPKAVDRLLKVQERRAKLLGLDAPTKLANADGSNIGPTEIRVIRASQAPQVPQA